jgi:hypothetical protein
VTEYKVFVLSLNILITAFWYTYKYTHPVLTKLNLETLHSQSWEVAVNVSKFMVEEAKLRYASSTEVKEINNGVATAISIRNERTGEK